MLLFAGRERKEGKDGPHRQAYVIGDLNSTGREHIDA
jgi:hypothetical protein